MWRVSRVVVFSSALAIVIISSFVLLPPLASAQNYTATGKFRVCYFMFGAVDDLGWSYSFNQGRLQTHSAIQALYPNLQVESTSIPDVFFGVPDSQKVSHTISWIQKGCRVLIANNEVLFGFDPAVFDYYATTYPNVTFFMLNSQRLDNTTYANVIYVYTDPSMSYYLAGVAAAKQAKTCISFTAAFETSANPIDAVNGFALGVRAVNSTMPVEVVTMNSWYAPDAEVLAATLLTSKTVGFGCEVHARYSDPRSVDVAFASKGGAVMTVGPHADLQQFVGDTVLLSPYLQWDAFLTPAINATIVYGNPPKTGVSATVKPPYRLGTAMGTSITTRVSPLAATGVNDAVAAARTSLAGSTSLFCGAGLVTKGGQAITYRAGETCVNLADNVPGFLAFSNVHYHKQGFDDGSSTCPAGTYISHVVRPELMLSCLACPAGTFSSRGSSACTPCPNGTASGSNASTCFILPDTTAQTNTLIGVVVGVIGFVLVIGVIVVLASRSKASKRNEAAPRQTPFCLLFTDVQDSTELWSKYPDAMAIAIDVHHRVIREVIASVDAYEVKTVGDSFMIAARTAMDGALLAVEIQRALQSASWPDNLVNPYEQKTIISDRARKIAYDEAETQWNGLRVRIGLQYCTQAEPKYEALSNYYDYYGPDVNKCARVEAQAHGGQILMTQDTWDAIHADPEFDLVLGGAVQAAPYATHVHLKGIDADITLWSLALEEHAWRVFPPPLSGNAVTDDVTAAGDDIAGAHSGANVACDDSASSLGNARDDEKAGLISTLLGLLDPGLRQNVVTVLSKRLSLDPKKNLLRQEKLVVQALITRGVKGGRRRDESQDSAPMSSRAAVSSRVNVASPRVPDPLTGST